MSILKEIFSDEDGQGLVEYGLLLALIVVIVIAVLVTLGPKIGQLFSRGEAGVDSALSGGAPTP